MGQRQNVSSTITQAMAAQGYTVSLHGKMDTGGGPSMNPPTTFAHGFHGTGTWSANPLDRHHATQASTYDFPGVVLHSWATGANIPKPIFGPLGSPNHIDDEHANSSESQDWLTVDECVQFLREYRPGDAPFFLYCSVLNPHPPYTSNATYEASVDLEQLEASVRMASKTWLSRSSTHPADMYMSRSEAVPGDFDTELARRLALAYFGQIAETDAMLGRVVSALMGSEAAPSTYTVFASDHGEMRMEHRLIEKMAMYEGSARVPLLVTGPGVPSGVTVSDVSSLIDLFPTFLDMSQATRLPDAGLQGYSLAPYLGIQPRRGLHSRPQQVVAEYFGEHANTPQFMLRVGDWKYIAYGREPPYQNYRARLFNVTADPLEVEDLAGSPSFQAVVDKLDTQLRSVTDYPSITKLVNAENRAHVRRWMEANAQEDKWKELFLSAFDGADDDDVSRFLRWLHVSGEFAPEATPPEAASLFV